MSYKGEKKENNWQFKLQDKEKHNCFGGKGPSCFLLSGPFCCSRSQRSEDTSNVVLNWFDMLGPKMVWSASVYQLLPIAFWF